MTSRRQVAELRAQVDALQADNTKLGEALRSLRREHDAHMADTGVADLVRAKSALQELNVDLSDELDAARSQLALATAEVASLGADRKRLQAHVTKLEQALQAKLPKTAKGASSVNAQLQQEIGILINENLEMREQVGQAVMTVLTSGGAAGKESPRAGEREGLHASRDAALRLARRVQPLPARGRAARGADGRGADGHGPGGDGCRAAAKHAGGEGGAQACDARHDQGEWAHVMP